MASRRGYLTQAELAEYADITITDTAEADDQISRAEELIDAYVGPQDKAIKYIVEGHASAGTSTTLTLEAQHQNNMQKDYLKGCEIEIIGGTGAGQRTIITGQTYAGVVTFGTLSTAPDSTSIYRIYQLGKFPRVKDEFYDGNDATPTYYRQIPEAVKRATAAQVQYFIEMGEKFFATDESNYTSESIGNYSYSKGEGTGGGSTEKLIAPKAKAYLRGIMNRKGIAC